MLVFWESLGHQSWSCKQLEPRMKRSSEPSELDGEKWGERVESSRAELLLTCSTLHIHLSKAHASFGRLSKQPGLPALSLQLSAGCYFTSVLHLLFQPRPQANIHFQLGVGKLPDWSATMGSKIWHDGEMERFKWPIRWVTGYLSTLACLLTSSLFLWLLLQLLFLLTVSFVFLSRFHFVLCIIFFILYSRAPLAPGQTQFHRSVCTPHADCWQRSHFVNQVMTTLNL